MNDHWIIIPAELNPARTGALRKTAAGHTGTDPRACAVCKAVSEEQKRTAKIAEENRQLKKKIAEHKEKELVYEDQLRRQLKGARSTYIPLGGNAYVAPDRMEDRLHEKAAKSVVSTDKVNATKLHLYEATLVYVSRASAIAPCSRAEAAMTAWRDDPLRWGLRGFERESSDAHIISKYLTLLCQDGLLLRPSVGFYQLTERGRHHLSALARSAARSDSAD